MSLEGLSTRVSEINLPRSRRRGLKSLSTLLQIPLLSRTGSFQVPVSSALQLSGGLPVDILYEITEYLTSGDVLNLSLTSSHVRDLLLPALYETVVLKSSRACRSALTMFIERPVLCRYIRKLAVRPNYYLAWPKANEPLDEDWVADMLYRLAGQMPLLHTFDWDGLEMPKDQLWKTLKQSCPLLKTVYTNIGYRALDPDSSLFDFTDLTSFSLTVRHSLEETNFFPEQEQLPERLWNMLFNNCPDLEDLTLSSFSPSTRLLNIDRLCNAKWSKLHTLTLGSFGYNDDFELNPPDANIFGAFLSRHASLKYLRLSWNFMRWMSPDSIPMVLDSSALSQLTTFVGVHQQLTELPNPRTIETLDLTCEPLFESRVPSVCTTLRTLTSLTSLDLWLHIPDPKADQTQFFRDLMTSCPKLTDLHFMCTTSFVVKPLLCLSAHLCLLPQLKRFSLTKGHKYRGDESMLSTALRVIRSNPNLSQVNIRWAREKCPNHLKQEGSYDVIRRYVPDSLASGSSSTEIEAKVKAVEVFEKGITVLGKVFTRRYRYDFKMEKEVGDGGESSNSSCACPKMMRRAVKKGKTVRTIVRRPRNATAAEENKDN